MVRRLFSCAMLALFTVSSPVSAAEVEIVSRQIGVKDYCAWPNVTKLPDGTLAAVIFNQPSHGRLEGEVECWTSRDGKAWSKAGVPRMHEPMTNWMNVGCGLNRRGELVVLSSGWTLKKGPDDKETNPKGLKEVDLTRRAFSATSGDGGRTWKVYPDAFPERPEGSREFIPFGDIVAADDGSLRVCAYVSRLEPKQTNAWMLRSEDDGATWTRHALIANDHSETTLLHLGQGCWLAAARRQLNGTPTDLFRSDDDGKTWTLAVEKIGEPAQHPADLTRLSDGRLLLSLGIRQKGKFGVGVRLSDDDGATWGPLLTLFDDCVNFDCGYPASVQLADGTIATAYYSSGTPQHAGYQFATVLWKLPAK